MLTHLSSESDIVDAIFPVKPVRSLPQPDPATGNDYPEMVNIFGNEKFVIRKMLLGAKVLRG